MLIIKIKGDVGKRGGCGCGGRGYVETFHTFAQFGCEPKTVLKNEIYKKKSLAKVALIDGRN